MNHDVTSIFNKFAGQEIAIIERESEVKIGKETYRLPEVTFANPQDPLLTGMEETAKKNGLHLRIWLPGTMGTMDIRMDRVNVHIGKDMDGKWRIGRQFTLG